MPYLSLVLLISAALFSGLTVLSLLITIRSGREHRNTIFPIVRETEGAKAKKYALASGMFLVLTALSIGGWVATQQNPDNILQAKEATQQAISQQALSALIPAAEAASHISASPSTTEIVSGQVDPTIFSEVPTNTPQSVNKTGIVTVEPTHSPIPILASPIKTATPFPTQKTFHSPVPQGVGIGPIIFTSDVNNRQKVQNSAEVFDVQTERVYAVFPYRGMKNGLPFSVIWYYQNIELGRDDYEWRWGNEGQSYFFIKLRNVGAYKVEFRIDNEVVADGSFEVTP